MHRSAGTHAIKCKSCFPARQWLNTTGRCSSHLRGLAHLLSDGRVTYKHPSLSPFSSTSLGKSTLKGQIRNPKLCQFETLLSQQPASFMSAVLYSLVSYSVSPRLDQGRNLVLMLGVTVTVITFLARLLWSLDWGLVLTQVNRFPSPCKCRVLPLKLAPLSSTVTSQVHYENVIDRDTVRKLSTVDNQLFRQLQTQGALSAWCCSGHGRGEAERVS